MNQLELLWEYQKEDIKADKIAADIRKNPARQKLEKTRDFIIEKQKAFKVNEEKLTNMADRIDIIREALPRCESQLSSLVEKMEKNAPETAEEVEELLKEAARCKETIQSYEGEMKRIVKESTDLANHQKTIRHQAATAKVDFDTQKASYDKVLQEQKASLDAQRSVIAEKGVDINEALLAKYNAIKKHVFPPIARLTNDQCGGCNTSLPSALVRKVRASEDGYECETCGRLLIP